MYQLLIHQWKEKRRSPFWTKSILLNLLLAFLGLWMFLMAISLSFAAIHIISRHFSHLDITEVFTGLLFYYFVFDIITRFLMQQLPTASIQPYRTIPVKKNLLLHYPLVKSIPGFFNILPFFLILPFFFRVICTSMPISFSLAWIISFICLVGINNFLNFSIKKHFIKRPVLVLFLLLLAGTSLFLDFQEIFRPSLWFAKIIMYVSASPPLVIIPVALLIMTYRLAFNMLKMNYYPEETGTSRAKTSSLSFLSRYGETGELLGVELKMILRNKRPRSLMILSLLFLGYGMIMYDDPESNFKLMFAGFIMTFAFAANYGQFLFSWEGSYFDSYLANKISTYQYIRSKYLLFAITGLIGFLLTLPYILISTKIPVANLAMLLYNVGVSSILMLVLTTNNSTSIELEKSPFMNYQGTGAIQFLMLIPLMGIPVVILILFSVLGLRQYTFLGFGVIGLISIIFSKYLLQMVTNLFLSRKYEMSSGFRKIK
jgi:hypothetical protein